MRYLVIIYAVVLVQMIALVQGKSDFWNYLIYYQGKFQQSNQYYSSSLGLYDLQNGTITLQILSDDTFIYRVNQGHSNIQQVIKGQVSLDNKISLIERQYALTTDRYYFNGTISYKIGYGVDWSYFIDRGYYRKTQKSQIKYPYLSWNLLLGFVLTGIICIPIADKKRNKILYNLEKRIHPLSLMVILIKLISVFQCFLLFGYQSMVTVPVWSIVFVAGFYLLCLAPSVLHCLYFLSSFQKSINGLLEKYRENRNTLMMAITCSVFIVSIVLPFVGKGIALYYFLSWGNIMMYWYACWIKKYVQGKLIIYDACLTAVLTMISLFLPVMNYNLISFKQAAIFWNYYIIIFLFGCLLMKLTIQYEQPDQIQIQQDQNENYFQRGMGTNIRRAQSIEIIR